MPASRSARAMTLAPRSWPSSPGLAITTLILFMQEAPGHQPPVASRHSYERLFLVLAPDVTEGIAHFAHRRVRAHALEQRIHRIARPSCGCAQRVERPPDGVVVAR